MTTIDERPIRATGGCQCGALRYKVRGPLRDVLACHCAICRRIHTFMGAYSACDPADLEMTGETLRWYESTPAAKRGFCAACGTHLIWAGTGKSHVSLSAGSIDEPTGVRLVKHICTNEKGDFYQIADDVPKV